MSDFIKICEQVKQLEVNGLYGSAKNYLVEHNMTLLNGSSDDNIYFNGLTYGQFDGYDKKRIFTFEDDTKISIKYTSQGIWEIKVLRVGNAEQYLIKTTNVDKDYSDMFFIKSKKRGKQDE